MTIKSMTGFARADGATAAVAWHWEVRSVNGRGLDLRLRLPPGYEALEPRCARPSAGTSRAAASPSASTSSAAKAPRRSASTRRRWRRCWRRRPRRATWPMRRRRAPRRCSPSRACSRWSSSRRRPSRAAGAQRGHAASRSTARSMALVARARRRGRAARSGAQRRSSTRSSGWSRVVEASPARARGGHPAAAQGAGRPAAGGRSDGLDEARLHQEAALLATRADVEEELKRLHAHIAAARELLAERAPVGRKLDFLAQEFNREANTLCSKASDVEMTRAGLELKAVIDQMREQVQNIE